MFANCYVWRINDCSVDIPGHADVLRQVYTEVLQRFDAQSVARNMFQCNAITLKELQSIQSKHKQPIKAAERLLNIVIDQSSTVYAFFMSALKDTGHKAVYDTIVNGSYKGTVYTVYNRVILQQRYYLIVYGALSVCVWTSLFEIKVMYVCSL